MALDVANNDELFMEFKTEAPVIADEAEKCLSGFKASRSLCILPVAVNISIFMIIHASKSYQRVSSHLKHACHKKPKATENQAGELTYQD